MKHLVLDSEPVLIPAEAALKSERTDLIPKAPGQKIGLAIVSIRLVRGKARVPKLVLPPHQFNMDSCLVSIQVLNRIPKVNGAKSSC